ncbi:MAG: hypothetical protein ACK55E_04570 [Cyanobacteriota bacterium]
MEQPSAARETRTASTVWSPVSGESRRAFAVRHPASSGVGLADALQAAASTDEARTVLLDHGITISSEALWRHRGSLLKEGQPTWRG